MEATRSSVQRGARLHRVIALALAAIASIPLACGDRERDRASVPPPPPPPPPVFHPRPVEMTRASSDSADSARARHLAESDSTCDDAVPSSHCAPVTIDGVAYTVETEDHAQAYADGVKRVRIYDDSARLVYEESFRNPFPDSTDERLALSQRERRRRNFSRDEMPQPRNWTELKVEGLEDATGRARGFLLTYIARIGIGYIPHIYYRIVTPRAGALRTIVPKFDHPGTTGVRGEVDYYSQLSLREGSRRGSVRLLEGDRLLVAEWRNRFTAYIPYRVDFGCEPGAESCLTLAPFDSSGGLARFAIDTLRYFGQYDSNDTLTLELFAAPGAARPERVTLKRREVSVLEGAGRVSFGGVGIDGTDADLTKDDWLRIRVRTNGRTGWVRGARAFDALGFGTLPRPPAGSERGEM